MDKVTCLPNMHDREKAVRRVARIGLGSRHDYIRDYATRTIAKLDAWEVTDYLKVFGFKPVEITPTVA